MGNTLIDEALADAKQLKELAMNNAKLALIEQVTPKLRQLIDQELLSEGQHNNDQEVDPEDGDTTMHEGQHDNDQETDPENGDNHEKAGVSESSEFDLNTESMSVIAPLLRATASSADRLELNVASLSESIARVCKTPVEKRGSAVIRNRVSQLFSKIDDTYSRVRESKAIDNKRRARLEEKLESCYAELIEEFKEIAEMKTSHLREADDMNATGAPPATNDAAGVAPEVDDSGDDVVITLKGLKDVDADSLNVDVQVGDEDDGEGGGDDDFLAGLDDDDDNNNAPQQQQPAQESLSLSDDTILEISDVELKREVARMQRMRMNESDFDVGKPMPKGGKIPVDDFGDGHDDGDPWLDHDVTTEGVEDLEENDPVVEIELESDDLDECGMEMEDTDVKVESRSRALMKALAEAADASKKARAYSAIARRFGSTARGRQFAKAARIQMNRLHESKARVARLRAVSRGAARNASPNLVKEVKELRSQLSDANLTNAKLLYVNKLFQTNEGLSVSQRNRIIDAFDSAKSLKEAKMLFVKLSDSLANRRKSAMNESVRSGRMLGGSGSRVGKPSGALLNESAGNAESIEVERWQVLAGIRK